MIQLVPAWTYHFEKFWDTVKSRNLWFIKLRFLFVILLIGFLISGEYSLNFNFSTSQHFVIISLSVFIFIYNFIFIYLRKRVSTIPERFNPLHLSMIQMISDLIVLMILIYFTGTIESPFNLFLIFQVIIGSLILPGYIVYFITAFFCAAFILLIILTENSIIPYHIIAGLYSAIPDRGFNYTFLFILTQTAMLGFSSYLANRIARELYQQEQQLIDTLKKLEESEIAKQKYIMGVVHEIKSPIAAMLSLQEIVLEKYVGPISDEVEIKLKKAHQRGLDAIELINNVLRISKLKLLDEVSDEYLQIEEIIDDLLKKKADKIASTGCAVKFSDNRNNKKPVRGDKVLLDLALSNIIENAIKYSVPDGKIEIQLETYNDTLTLKFTDNGIGIPQKEIDKVFHQFFRASNISKESHEGSGLGLTLVKEIIERHNGTIKIVSPVTTARDKRPGTEITIELTM